jgi:hypothetical protein
MAQELKWMQGNKKKVGFYCEPDKWESFKKLTKAKNSDANKTLRILIDEYLSKNSQLLSQLNLTSEG